MKQIDLKNILVTRAEEFIGAHYARLLYEHRYNVFILDKRTYTIKEELETYVT